MIKIAFLSATLLSVLPIAAAIADTATPTKLMVGSVYEHTGTPSQSGYACAIKAGAGSFQREAATTKEKNPDALLSLPEVTIKSGATTTSYSALATLDFSTATSGKIMFDDNDGDDAAPKTKVAFAGYSQVYSSKTFELKVTFNLNFKGCTLPVKALFRAAPQPHVIA